MKPSFEKIVSDEQERKDKIKELMNKKLDYITRSDEEVAELNHTPGMNLNVWSNDMSFNKMIDDICYNYLGWELPKKLRNGKTASIHYAMNTIKAKREVQLMIILVNLFMAEGRWMSFSRDNSFYAKPLKKYSNKDVTKNIINIMDELVEHQLVEQAKGTKDIVTGLGFVTKVRPTERLLDIFKGVTIKIPFVLNKNAEVLIMKEENKKTYKTKEGKVIIQKTSGDLVDYRENAQVRERREAIKLFNDFVSSFEYTVNGEVPKGSSSSVRIFNNASWEMGGRYYSNFWSVLPKATRKTIKIDGQDTVELDYRACFLSLCYSLSHLPVPKDDPYFLQDIDRGIVKLVCMRCLGGNSKEAVIEALIKMTSLRRNMLLMPSLKSTRQ